MIQSLHDLGIALKEDPDNEDYFASYSNPFAGYSGTAKVVVVDIKNDKVMDALDEETFQIGNASRYLYRKPKGARGAPLVPTGPLYPQHSLETDNQRNKQVATVAKIMSRIERSIPEGSSVYFSGTSARQEGLKTIEGLFKQFTGPVDNRYIYTIRIDDKYLGDIQELRELLDDEAYAKYYEKSQAVNKTCALTQEQGVEVWGRVDTLGFTVNDITFNRGGFDDSTSYRMFPVSRAAVLSLEAARRYAFARLADRFYTLEYLIVPRLIEGTPAQLAELASTIDGLRADVSLTEKVTPILKANGLLELLAAEEGLNKAGLLYDILFYQKNQAQLALLLHLQDVNPSRLQFIRQCFEQINRRYGHAFSYRNKEKERVDFHFTFGMAKNFFSEGKGLKVRFDPFFYRLLECVFYGLPLDESTVTAALVRKLREAFKNDGDDYHLPFHTTLYHAIATRSLLSTLGLFTTTNSIMEETQPVTLRRTQFLEEHADFFSNQPALKGAFLLGCLTSMLTYAQYKHLDSKPFLKNLNNLNLGLEELRGLLPVLLNKIQEYQARSGKTHIPSHGETTQLAAEVGELLMKRSKPSRDDISFAFATGMVMQDRFGMEAAEQYKRDKVANEAEASAP